MAVGVPQARWMVYKGKSQSEMDDWGYPYDLGNLHVMVKVCRNIFQKLERKNQELE